MIYLLLNNITILCGNKGISIAKLEKELGFGNATIRMWAKASPSVEKVKAVADYFGVSVNQLISEHQGMLVDTQ